MVGEIYTKILKQGADKLFRAELLEDQQKVDFRMDVCSKCENFNTEDQTCGICGCFMEVKTTHKTTRNIRKMRIETTHCPMGKWDDKDVANHYRQMDGQKLLD